MHAMLFFQQNRDFFVVLIKPILMLALDVAKIIISRSMHKDAKMPSWLPRHPKSGFVL